MTGKNDFQNIQRRNSEVMAKYEWTSSLMSMQKSPNEIHDRRSKTHRKANEFLQGLLQKRSDGSLLDDHGALDRYQRFLKYKTKSNDDDVLSEFDRKLRALNKERRNQVMNTKESMTVKTTDCQVTRETQIDSQWKKFPDRIREIKSTTTSNNTSLLSSIASESNHSSVHFFVDGHRSTPSSLEQSLASSSNETNSNKIHKPKVRRADGTEFIPPPTRRTLRRASSNILIFNHCHFPRALKSRESIKSTSFEQEASPVLSIVQQDCTELYHILDQIENESSHVNLTNMLDQFLVSSTQIPSIEKSISEHQSEQGEEIVIHSNLFDQADLSSSYYTTVTMNVENTKRISLYTMTIGIVQLTPSLTVPYSILNGRRPVLQSSIRTNFRKIYSKRPKHISQVTAIESSSNTDTLQVNDIIIRVRIFFFLSVRRSQFFRLMINR